jgi:hypothetical protein
MANTVRKGQLTLGLVSFPVRLVRAARKDRVPLRYVREVVAPESQDEDTDASLPPNQGRAWPENDHPGVSATRGMTYFWIERVISLMDVDLLLAEQKRRSARFELSIPTPVHRIRESR